MSPTEDIIPKSTATSVSFICEPQTENKDRAIPEDYPDRIQIHHHNERPRKERPKEQQEPQTDPAPEPEQEPEIPFSEWDGEEGTRPHN